MARIIENKEIEPMNLNSRTLTRNFHYSSSLILFSSLFNPVGSVKLLNLLCLDITVNKVLVIKTLNSLNDIED